MAFKMNYNNGNFPFKKTIAKEKTFENTEGKDYIDPDAPGTPGQPGFEPPVLREDLDERGKQIWDAHRAKKKGAFKKEGKTGRVVERRKSYLRPEILKDMDEKFQKEGYMASKGWNMKTGYRDGV